MSTKYILIIVLAVSAFLSCQERIDITTDNDSPKLIITGLITTDTMAHKIQISRSVQYLGNENIKYYLDGIVKLNGIDLQADSLLNAYITPPDFYGIPGKEYNLDVWIDFNGNNNVEHYTASATMPDYIALDSINLNALHGTDTQGGPPWILSVAFQDPPGPNYYGAGLFINKFNYTGSLTYYFVNEFNASVEDGKYITFPVFFINKEMRHKDIEDQKIYLKPGDTLTLSLNSMNLDYFNFIKAAKQEIDGGGNPLFAGPPANVPSNINGGALGIFGAYTISRKQIYLPETPTFVNEEE
jgi:hypothetical protein